MSTTQQIDFKDWADELVRIFRLMGTPNKIDTEAFRCHYDDGLTPAEAIAEDFSNA